MKDQFKTKQVLIQELTSLRQRISELEQSESERTRTEEASKKSEARFHSYFDMPFHGIAIISPEKRWIQVNDRICSIMGYSRDEIVCMTWAEMTHPDDLAADLDQFNRVLSGQTEYYNIDKRFIRKDGKVVWTSLSVGCIRKSDGRVDHMIALVEDITSGKLAEALRESEEKYRSIFENAVEGIFQTTPEGRYISVNPALARMFGYDSPEDMMSSVVDIGRKIYVNPEQRKEHLRLLDEKRVVESYEARMYRKDGSIIWVSINTRTVRDDADNPFYYEGSAIDITERKRAEDELLSTLRQLQEAKDMLIQSEKLSAIGLLASGAAHEILNPLNILSLKLQMLEIKPPAEDDLKENLKICNNQINRIVTIVGGLRKFSRIPEHKLEEKNIAEIIDNVLSLSAPRIKTEDVTTEVYYDQSVPLLHLDKEAIEQVLFNLVSNALDTMRGKEKRILRLSTEKKEDKVLIGISDTGHGIKEGDLLKLFDPFFTTKGPDKGTGLGLSVSYGIIKDHNGRIWAENNAAGGATFFIELPV